MSSHQVLRTARRRGTSRTSRHVSVRVVAIELVRPRRARARRARVAGAVVRAVSAVRLALVRVLLTCGAADTCACADVAWVPRQMLPLGHVHVVLVDPELLAVQPDTKAQVGGQNGEQARDDTGDDGADVCASTSAARGIAPVSRPP